jgi:hypothetical protein
MTYRILTVGAIIAFAAGVSPCQSTTPDLATQQETKHLFWLIPNYRTSASLTDYKPLTPSQKFKIAAQDSFDRGTIALAAIFGAEGQLSNSNRSFGQGAAGFGRYFGTAYGDFLIGNFMTEGVFPSLLHQDPRYFRRGTGTAWSRIGYAVGQTLWTHKDSGGMQFNYSEVLGNSAAAAISTAYYADNRTAGDAVSKLGTQIGIDMAANVLKEFYPDIERKFTRKHKKDAAAVK